MPAIFNADGTIPDGKHFPIDDILVHIRIGNNLEMFNRQQVSQDQLYKENSFKNPCSDNEKMYGFSPVREDENERDAPEIITVTIITLFKNKNEIGVKNFFIPHCKTEQIDTRTTLTQKIYDAAESGNRYGLERCESTVEISAKYKKWNVFIAVL